MYCYMQKLSAATLIVLSESKSRLVEKFSKAKSQKLLLLVILGVGRRQKRRKGKSKSLKSAKSIALKSPESNAKALVIAGCCAAVLVVLRAVRGRQTVQFCAVAFFSISSPPPCCRANKAHCRALQAAR